MKYFWIISLCFFFVGCNRSYVGVPLVSTEPTTGEPDEYHPPIEPGSEIRLTLKDGRVVKARFEGILDDSLVISEARIQGSPQDSFSEIQQTDIQVTSKKYKILLGDVASLEKLEVDTKKGVITMVLVVGCVAGLVYMMAYTSDHMFDDWGE